MVVGGGRHQASSSTDKGMNHDKIILVEDAFINNYQHILMGYFLNNNVDLERVSMHNIVY